MKTMSRKEWARRQFVAIFDRTMCWASVLPTEDWRRPFRMMGVVELARVRPPPPPPRVFRL
jgi:hypothetical protein